MSESVRQTNSERGSNPIGQLAWQSINQSVSLSINQSVSQSINQSISHSNNKGKPSFISNLTQISMSAVMQMSPNVTTRVSTYQVLTCAIVTKGLVSRQMGQAAKVNQ